MDNFLNLERLIEESLGEDEEFPRRMSSKELAQWNNRVHARLDSATPTLLPLPSDPLEALLEEALRPPQNWITDAAVVLIHEVGCMCCLQVEQTCQGWFTSQHHRTDKHARRLVKGRPQGTFPIRVERHQHGSVDICANCAESQVLIEEASQNSALSYNLPASWRILRGDE